MPKNITTIEAMGSLLKNVMSLVTITPDVDSYFRSLFRDEVSAAEACTFEIVRTGRKTFDDIDINGEPIITRLDKSTQKLFKTPYWDIAVQYSAMEAFQRVAGGGEYINGQDYVSLVDEVAKKTQDNINAMRRVEERMSAEAVINGVITLKNSDSLDYKRRAASIRAYAAGIDFSDNAIDPRILLKSMAEDAVENGMIANGTPFVVTMGSDANEAFWANDFIKENADIRRYETIEFNPQGGRPMGSATMQGVVKYGDYRFVINTYGGRYDTPAPGNVSTKFLDSKKIVMFPMVEDMDNVCFYGGCPVWSGPQGTSGRYPKVTKGKIVPYEADSELKVQKMVGFRTRPLPIPRHIDVFETATVLS